MLDLISMWAACVALCAIPGFFFPTTTGLGVSILLSFLAPTWLIVDLGGVPFDVKTAVAIISLLSFALRTPKLILCPLTWVDATIASMVILQVVADSMQGDLSVALPLLAYGEWGLPYVAGRYVLREQAIPKPVIYTAAGVLVVLSIGGLFEMWYATNPWELLVGNRPVDGFLREASRQGLKRAFGPTMIPIFFGLLNLILLPWTFAMIADVESVKVKTFGWLCLVLGIFGVMSSVSRGPVLGVILLLLFGIAVWQVWLRWLVLISGIVLGLSIALNPTYFVTLLEEPTGELTWGRTVTIDGEEVPWSGTWQRIHIFKAFWPAYKNAGFLGYGSTAVSKFPPNIPHLIEDSDSLHSLRNVDHAYLLLGLRFGWLGSAFLLMILLATSVSGLTLTWDRSSATFLGWLTAVILSTALVLNTIFIDTDFGFALLWTCGVISGAWSVHRMTDLRSYN